MKRSWTADLKVVTPSKGEPKPVTVIMPYYDNPNFLARQMMHFFAMPEKLRQHLNLIIVDDCAAVPAETVMRLWGIGWRSVRLFRMDFDYRWGWLCARNRGFKEAEDGWCAVTDMDHVFNEPTLETLVYGELDESKIYGFKRLDIKAEKAPAEEIGPHPNSWMITRSMFWKVGGYDERLLGHYGTDGDWRRRMAKHAEIQILSSELLRYEHHGDSSTTKYLRKQPQDAAVSRLVRQRKNYQDILTLTVPYHEVQL